MKHLAELAEAAMLELDQNSILAQGIPKVEAFVREISTQFTSNLFDARFWIVVAEIMNVIPSHQPLAVWLYLRLRREYRIVHSLVHELHPDNPMDLRTRLDRIVQSRVFLHAVVEAERRLSKMAA